MADEVSQKGDEQIEKATETVETPPVEPEKTEEEIDESKEPGGDSPQDVYRRKLFRQAKASREEAQREREGRIAAETRAQTLEEQASKPPIKAKPTVQEVQAAMDAGTVSISEGTAYIARSQAEEIVEQKERLRQQNEAALRPIQKAAQDIQAYVEAAPWLADDTDERTLEVGHKYQQLVNDFGYAPNLATKRVAIEMALGPVNRLKAQRETANLTARSARFHAETPAGGGNTPDSRLSDIANAPPTMKAYWEKAGLTQAQRKREFEIYRGLKAQNR